MKKIFFYNYSFLNSCSKNFTFMDLCLYNEESLKIHNLELKISGKSYYINNLNKKICKKVKIYSDTDIDIKFCIGNKLIHLKELGYYTNNIYNKIITEIFFIKIA